MWQVREPIEVCTGVWCERLRKTVSLENLDISGRNVLKFIIKKRNGGTDRIGPALERDWCRAVVGAVANLWVGSYARFFLSR